MGPNLGLAGILALFCASVLRLEHSTWSILTVVVMMSSQYVGSITVKVILRISGTISGALLGIWLVGSYASSPVVLLIALFFVMAFATYKFGQYPASQTPYFHFLVGLTLLTVTTYGVDAPNQIWETGLNRMLETLVGASECPYRDEPFMAPLCQGGIFRSRPFGVGTASKLLPWKRTPMFTDKKYPVE